MKWKNPEGPRSESRENKGVAYCAFRTCLEKIAALGMRHMRRDSAE